MRRLLTPLGLSVLVLLLTLSVAAQQVTTVSGTVKNGKSKEMLSAVSISVKGGTAGTYTDDKGSFKFATVQKLPFTLLVSSVGYAAKELIIKENNQQIDIALEAAFTLGNEIVVSASRVPERILESPVSIERISAAAIRNTPSANYYDMVANLKGVDVVSASLTFTSIGTRGFNSSGNTRLNQIVDGMDNQAPGLNFSVGNITGVTELDVDNIELLQGASSALYGPGGTNGTLLINSKNPFKHQGLSFQIKQGVNHIDSKQRPRAPYYDWSVRYAAKVSDKFAYKINAQFLQAQDWTANNMGNYLRSPLSAQPNGEPIGGSRTSDPNFDGVNIYGDETSVNMSAVSSGVIAATGLSSGTIAAFNGFLTANPGATIANFNAFLTGAGAGALVAAGISPILYGASPSRNYFNNQMVSRTGYDENQVVDPTTLNFKFNAALHYKISDKVEAILAGNWGTGNTVYTGLDRYSIKEFTLGQYKAELRAKNWYVRAYTTRENSGSSYATITTTRIFNEAWKSSRTQWYPQYLAAYSTAINAGLAGAASHNLARGVADQGRPTTNILNNPLFQGVAGLPISKGGGLFLDRSRLSSFEGQYNLTESLDLAKHGTDVLIGGNWRQFQLNSQGTLFADTAGPIKINEMGAYLQISQKLLGDRIKLTGSGRYDKNTNFQGRFTPRVSVVVKLAEDHNLRFSYQTAYRFPTTQNQWINLNTSQGRLMGGLPQLRDFYNFQGNAVYTVPSVQAFGASVLAGSPNPALLQVQQFGALKPESTTSFEVGYKGLIAKKLLIDVYAYKAKYKDFISGVNVIQQKAGIPASLFNLLNPDNRNVYNITVNAPGNVDVTGWGASVEYMMPQNFSVNANIYSDVIGEIPVGFVSYFNTPKYRSNIGFANSGFGKDNRFGFNIMYRWVDNFFYEGTLATGNVVSYSTVDAQVNYKFPKTKSILKFGGTNIFNKYYYNAFGNVQIGGLYYVSFGWNVF